MIAIYAICILFGVIGILTWVTLGLVSSTFPDKARLEPESRLGSRGRTGIAALSGFGLGGMSASFAGWNSGFAVVGAAVGAVVAVLVARYLGFEEEPDGDSA